MKSYDLLFLFGRKVLVPIGAAAEKVLLRFAPRISAEAAVLPEGGQAVQSEAAGTADSAHIE